MLLLYMLARSSVRGAASTTRRWKRHFRRSGVRSRFAVGCCTPEAREKGRPIEATCAAVGVVISDTDRPIGLSSY